MSIIASENFLSRIKTLLGNAEEHRQKSGRPFCTLTYAQSLDGCIAHSPMNAMALSGQESKGARVLRFTSDSRGWVKLEPLLKRIAEMGVNR
ncbi:MAG: hypothetical protein JRI32_08030 [Deltaproteobacteria bacterium]|nr:hypothetical protein [Deltaproteobacteria bacterium]